MDPITAIVTALALGAASGLKRTAEKVIVDAYSGLKGLIQRKYHSVSLDALEANPKSTARRAVVAEDLEQTGITDDSEALNQAKNLLDLIRKHAPETGPEVGVSLEDIEAASLKIQNVIATGPGVQVKGGKFAGPVEISGIRAGAKSSDPSKKKQ